MDSEFGLIVLESELLAAEPVRSDQLGYYAEAVVAAATVSDGYSGIAWKGGAKLLEAAQQHGQDPTALFDTFGWDALAGGIQAGLEDNQILSALSYATVSFVPRASDCSVFDHPQVAKAICTGLARTPRPFVKPAELSAADEVVQREFGELLERLSRYSADNELILQWAASGLRVLPLQSRSYQAAAICLLRTLCLEGRSAAAYYAFRALSEQLPLLWDHPVTLEVLCSFVDRYRQDSQVEGEVLTQLCIDDDIVHALSGRFDLLVLIGALAVHRVRHHADKQAEVTAWRFVNEVYGSSVSVAVALGEYLTDGSLPPLPTCRADQIKALEWEVAEAIRSVDRELGPRKYKPLAMRIYQSNIQETFSPMLDRIRSGQRLPDLVRQIEELDPEQLVTGSEWLRLTPDRIGSRVLRKMTADNSRTLQGLTCAALKRIELDKLRAELTSQPTDEFGVFYEFDVLLKELDMKAQWALKTLLSELWTRLQEGLSVAERELEAKRHGAKQH